MIKRYAIYNPENKSFYCEGFKMSSDKINKIKHYKTEHNAIEQLKSMKKQIKGYGENEGKFDNILDNNKTLQIVEIEIKITNFFKKFVKKRKKGTSWLDENFEIINDKYFEVNNDI